VENGKKKNKKAPLQVSISFLHSHFYIFIHQKNYYSFPATVFSFEVEKAFPN